MPLRHFLIVYDTANQRLVEQRDLGADAATATEAYGDAERTHGIRQGLEIVLIGADSLDTIRRTHAHYFEDSSEDPFAELALPA